MASDNIDKFLGGIKGGGTFTQPNLPPKMTIVDKRPPVVDQLFTAKPVPKQTPESVWSARRSK